MKSMVQKITGYLALVVLLTACSSAPFTERKQLLLTSEAEENKMGLSAYQEEMKKDKLSDNPEYKQLVTRVGQRIAKAADRPDYQWEFAVVESKEVNAFCLPGGKIVVYTGILPITQSEAGLAAVVGHEVAHALARHGGERMSQSMLSQGLLQGAGIFLGNNQGVMAALGLGTQVGILLPFSRTQESEADHIGLILMSKAGYDPHEAVGLWQRMKAASQGKTTPEFLSTHPADDTRIEQLQKWMPEALTYYKPGS